MKRSPIPDYWLCRYMMWICDLNCRSEVDLEPSIDLELLGSATQLQVQLLLSLVFLR